MNKNEILDILRGHSGGAFPDRGVRADDILLGRYAELARAGGAPDFWQEFSKAFRAIWDEPDTEAIEAAAAFVSGLEENTKQRVGSLGGSFSFLIEEVPAAFWGSADLGETRRRIVAGLRLLANLRLGERRWWRLRYWAWIENARFVSGFDGHLAWQAVLHASLGLMNTEETMPNIDAWLEDARQAKEFPAIELFTLLSRQTEYQSDKKYLKDEVIRAFHGFQANCSEAACSPRINDISSVIETWLIDRLKLSPAEAKDTLKWPEPSSWLPQKRLRTRKSEPAAARV